MKSSFLSNKSVIKADILCGADLISQNDNLFAAKRLALVTNPTGVNKNLLSTIDVLHEQYTLTALFSPEHGVRGDLQAGAHVASAIDEKTGIPIYSLYGENHHISDETLDKFDTIVFDIQDVGARFYTYLYTLSYIMEDCKKADKSVLILDRVNPIAANRIEGTILNPEFKSFVGRFPIATRTGLTIGEFAKYINKSQNINCDLTVIPCKGYNRFLYMDETNLIFIPPSPNLPTVDSCVCYIGTCLFEGTNMSEGRGTTRPFEQVGAPWLNTDEVIKNISSFPGVMLRKTFFTPTFSKHAGVPCKGIFIHVYDRDLFNPFEFAVTLIDTIRHINPEFEFLPPNKNGHCFCDLLLGSDELRHDNFSKEAFFESQRKPLLEYENEIKEFYLY